MNWIPLDELNAQRFRNSPRPPHELQRWCRLKLIRARKIGGKWFVDLDAFDHPEALQNHKVSPQVQALLDKFRAQGQH